MLITNEQWQTGIPDRMIGFIRIVFAVKKRAVTQAISYQEQTRHTGFYLFLCCEIVLIIKGLKQQHHTGMNCRHPDDMFASLSWRPGSCNSYRNDALFTLAKAAC
jgi:hypothetical protein